MTQNIRTLTLLVLAAASIVPAMNHARTVGGSLNYYVSFMLKSQSIGPLSPIQWQAITEQIMGYIEGSTSRIPNIPPHAALNLPTRYSLFNVKAGKASPAEASEKAQSNFRKRMQHLDIITPENSLEEMYLNNTKSLLQEYFTTYQSEIAAYIQERMDIFTEEDVQQVTKDIEEQTEKLTKQETQKRTGQLEKRTTGKNSS